MENGGVGTLSKATNCWWDTLVVPMQAGEHAWASVLGGCRVRCLDFDSREVVTSHGKQRVWGRSLRVETEVCE